MRIINPSRSTNFYESFSDLIFGTLIMLLVVVMALTLKLLDSQSRLVETIKGQIIQNQYTGGAAQSRWCFALVLKEGQPHIAFIPRAVWGDWDIYRHAGDTGSNPVLRLCEIYLDQSRGLTVVPVDAFTGLGASFSKALFQNAIFDNRIGDVITRILAVENIHGRDINRWGPRRLHEFVGGKFTHTDQYSQAVYNLGRFDASLQRVIEEYHAYILGPGSPLPVSDPQYEIRRYNALLEPMEPALSKTDGEPARIQFRASGQQTALLGQLELSTRQLREVLASLSVGKGFYIEFLSERGLAEEPPDWVVDEVLVPASFDKRVVSPQAIRILRKARRG